MISGDQDSSLIKNIQSPSTILTAVSDRTAEKINLQIEKFEQYLGDRIRKYKIFNPILKTSTDGTVVCSVKNLTAGENTKFKIFINLGNGQGVLFKRTEVMLLEIKSESSREGRKSSLFGENIPKLKSADKDIKTAAKNKIFIEIVQKYTDYAQEIFSILNCPVIFMYSSTEGGDSRGLTEVQGEKVDSEALDISGYLQLKTLGRIVIFKVLGMLHSICSICRLRYLNGEADLLVVTCSHATARIILLIIKLHAIVCHLYITCISILLPVTLSYCITRRSMMSDSFMRIVASETDGAVISLASHP